MDKENKKIRTEARKAWNREVRALVDFVKRKDKRVQAWKVELEAKVKQKQEEIARKTQIAKDKRLAERKEMLKAVKSRKRVMEQEHTSVVQVF